MAGKILTIFDMEFKRTQKTFFTVLGLLATANIMVMVYHLYVQVNYIENNYSVSLGLKVLKTDVGREALLNNGVIGFIYIFTCALMMLALIWCLFYGVRIWTRDFSEKTKSIYTLFMLPENKFIIYISKLLTMVVLTYGIILVQHIWWTLDSLLIIKLTGLSMNNILASINMANGSFVMIGMPSVGAIEFFVNYMISPIVVIIVIFTAVLMSKSRKRGGTLLGIIYIISLWYIYSSQLVLNNFYSDRLLLSVLVCNMGISLLSLGLSYNLLNKQVYA